MITLSTLIQIQGWNGELFTVAGEGQWDRGIALASEDAGTDFGGMYESPVETIYNATAFQLGSTFGGIVENEFDFILAFHAKGSKDMPFRLVDSDFRKAFSYTKDTKIIVEHDGTRRWLNVRLKAQPKLKAVNDPNSEQYGLLLYHLVGAYPRWLETSVTSSFIATTDTTVSGSETQNLAIANPTNSDMWVKWVLQGTAGIIWTIPDYSWGNDQFLRATSDAARKVVMPALIAGETVSIYTDPDSQDGQVNSNMDTEVYLRMAMQEFMYKVPPGTNTTIPVKASHAPIGALAQLICPREWQRPIGLE